MFIIGLDLDDTLMQPVLPAIDVAASNLGITNYKKETKDYWFPDLPQNLREEILKLFLTPEFMGSVVPIEGTQAKLVKWANQGHRLIVITARNESVRECTKELMVKYYPMVNEIHFVDIYESKARIMQELGIDIWIDDAPHGIKTSLGLHIPTYLISNDKTLFNHETRKLLPPSRVAKNVADIALDKACPWCGKPPRVLSKQPILDTGEFHYKYGCFYKGCRVQPYAEGLYEQICIDIWNSQEGAIC